MEIAVTDFDDKPMPMLSSSPLKTATGVAASASASASSTGAMFAYIHKYCEVATGGRAKFQGYHGFAAGGWYRFKCTVCLDNWNMKDHLFTKLTSCPKELTDWLVLHKHVCHSFTSGYPEKLCHSCGWEWNQHDGGKPVFDIESGMWVVPLSPTGPTGYPITTRECAICGTEIKLLSSVGLCSACYAAAKSVHENKNKTKEIVGRMFRKPVEEKRSCESDTGTEMSTSNDSSK
jgi:hypothetical protein